MKKLALISVYDKEGIVEFAKELSSLNYQIISTSKTYEILKKENIEVIEISEYTGFKEILKGRVKTLHPLIFGGILSFGKEEEGIKPISMVVCNLYPFEKNILSNLKEEEMIELIDIGGVSLLRAGAKNYQYVTTIFDKKDYPIVISEIKKYGEVSLELRKKLAYKAFNYVSYYDSIIAEYFRRLNKEEVFQDYLSLPLKSSLKLRYGENPHQLGFYYENPFIKNNFTYLWGKELSYNNLLDINSVYNIIYDFNFLEFRDYKLCCIIKHNTPCGVALGKTPKEAFEKAFLSDPKSAFGGIVGFNCEVDKETAEKIIDTLFLEVISAPSFSEEALNILKRKKNLRIIKLEKNEDNFEIRNCLSGYLLQEKDKRIVKREDFKLMTKRIPTEKELRDAIFGYFCVKYVKSNGIVIVKDLMTVGIGGGQTSRVDSVEIAIKKSEGRCEGGVLASDGFFPFRDSIDIAAKHNIKVIIEPGGSL
ncbi:MAG: bifunctional phosphoribosylaminoimidazolecarboxamide formyltransferase/IMP cyclohydrolase, partial [candidate division WOR-3 bacterium]|nr:bifunctional phosphoribosylaminoimidazolecarboxamide formyltransferase/IMP cyclohydrolase [candidate division WOR-3 bacterium]